MLAPRRSACSTISLVRLLTRRLEHRFITPAIHRIQALVESELFSRDVIQTAPVALCVLRRTDGEVVLERPLALTMARPSRRALGAGLDSWRLRPRRPQPHRLLRGCRRSPPVPELRAHPLQGGRRVRSAPSATSAHAPRVEAALEQARQSADAANEAKTLFLATMSHENPHAAVWRARHPGTARPHPSGCPAVKATCMPSKVPR